MKYLIDRLIVFNTDDGTLHLPASEDVIKLAIPAARLLETFLSSEGRELTREYLLETVWDKHGLHASGSNLNQYVSILRRNLALLGCHELIVTLPKVGFKLNAAISVDVQETAAVSPVPSFAKGPSTGFSRRHIVAGVLLAALLTGAAVGYYAFRDATDNITVLQTPDSACHIHYLKDIPDDERKATLDRILKVIANKKIQCKRNDVIIYSNEVSLSDKGNSRELLSYCHAGKSSEVISCENFYHYKWDKKK